MKKHENGFSTVEIIIIIIIVALLGFGGWYIYNAQNKPEATKTQQETPATKLSTTLVSHGKLFSIGVPDGWKITNDTQQDYVQVIGLAGMTYSAGKAASIVDARGKHGGIINESSFIIDYGPTADMQDYFSASEQTGTIKTSGGVEGKKYIYTVKPGIITHTAGTVIYGYLLTQGDRTAAITYLKLPSDPDQLKIVEDAVKSFKFL